MHISSQQGGLQWIHKLQIALLELDGPDVLLRIDDDFMDCVLEKTKKKSDFSLLRSLKCKRGVCDLLLIILFFIYLFLHLSLLWCARQRRFMFFLIEIPFMCNYFFF